jgi:ATP-dependent Clp protease ATP-binding subunit ClpA
VIDAFLERLLGRKAKGIPLASLFVRRALVEAWSREHREIDVEHLVFGLVHLTDVKPMLRRRGVEPLDVIGIVQQLLEERPVLEDSSSPPPVSPRFRTVCERAVSGERIELTPLFENVAAALPRELAFLRPALSASAPEIAAFFSAPLATTPAGQLSFAAWSPEMKGIVGLMQKQSDERIKGWTLNTFSLFYALVTSKTHQNAFTARGADVRAIVEELGREFVKAHGLSRRPKPPATHVASFTPALYAVFIRTERYAARDRTSVSLRHVLAALHDEEDLASAIEKLAR